MSHDGTAKEQKLLNVFLKCLFEGFQICSVSDLSGRASRAVQTLPALQKLPHSKPRQERHHNIWPSSWKGLPHLSDCFENSVWLPPCSYTHMVSHTYLCPPILPLEIQSSLQNWHFVWRGCQHASFRWPAELHLRHFASGNNFCKVHAEWQLSSGLSRLQSDWGPASRHSQSNATTSHMTHQAAKAVRSATTNVSNSNTSIRFHPISYLLRLWLLPLRSLMWQFRKNGWNTASLNVIRLWGSYSNILRIRSNNCRWSMLSSCMYLYKKQMRLKLVFFNR